MLDKGLGQLKQKVDNLEFILPIISSDIGDPLLITGLYGTIKNIERGYVTGEDSLDSACQKLDDINQSIILAPYDERGESRVGVKQVINELIEKYRR